MFNAESHSQGDVRNGEMFKSLHEGETNPTITLIISFDDSSVYKSATKYMSPITFAVAELKPQDRFLRKNIFMTGLWSGPSKPNVQYFLQAGFLDQYQKLQQQITFRDQVTGKITTFAVKVLALIADQPARAACVCVKQWNGSYGCGKCDHPTQLIPPVPPKKVLAKKCTQEWTILIPRRNTQRSMTPLKRLIL